MVAMSRPVSWVLAGLPAITGNNQTIPVYDTTGGDTVRAQQKALQHILVSCRFDQAVTVLYQIKRTGSSSWRTMNNGGAGDVVGANTDFVRDYAILGPDSKVVIVTGATGPSTGELDVGLIFERPLGLAL